MRLMTQRAVQRKYVVCIETGDCDDLELGKVYRVLPDKSAATDAYIRVIDESGEDYLYPESCFVPVDIPKEAQDALAKAG